MRRTHCVPSSGRRPDVLRSARGRLGLGAARGFGEAAAAPGAGAGRVPAAGPPSRLDEARAGGRRQWAQWDADETLTPTGHRPGRTGLALFYLPPN